MSTILNDDIDKLIRNSLNDEAKEIVCEKDLFSKIITEILKKHKNNSEG